MEDLNETRRLGLAVLAFATFACAASPDPNLVIVTIDTLRPDHMSAYGYERETTPRISGFAADGARFDLVYSPMPSTQPAHVTMFTGQQPITHGVVNNGTALPDDAETLAEILHGEGYRTAAFVSSFVLDARFGLAQGFETYADDFSGSNPSMVLSPFWGHEVRTFDRRAPETTREAIDWLRSTVGEAPGVPFFVFVHYFDPHAPYAPPAEAGLRFHEPGADRRAAQINLYDAEIAYVDGYVGELLDALDRLGLEETTLVVITSDHGEGLWDHGAQMHGVQIYEEQIRIPLLVRWPGRIAPGTRIAGPVGLMDVAPTVLDLLGIDADPHPFAGSSLAAALLGGAAVPARPVHSQRQPFRPGEVDGTRVAGELFGVREGRWKYIEGPVQGNRELYDLERDPGESDNRYYAEPEVVQRLRRLVSTWREEHAGRRLSSGFSDEDREGLEALGYVE